MPIMWREALSVDSGVIDGDHRHLIDLINSIEQTVTGNRPVQELKAEFDQLDLYTRQHFAREEEIMISLRYAKFDEHKALHLKLIDELVEVAKPVRAAADPGAATAEAIGADGVAKVSGLLRHWLIDHIIKEDLKLRAWLA